MKMITKILSTFALCLFLASFFISSPAIPADVSQSNTTFPTQGTMQSRNIIADYPDNYTEVSWDRQIVNEEGNQTWQSSHYKFGPTLNWHTRNATTGEIIAWDAEIPLNQWFDFVVEIPKTALSGQIPRAIAISGSYFNLSQMQDGEMQDLDQSSITLFAIYYVTEAKWEVFSSKNTQWPEHPPSEIPENFTLSDVFGPMIEPFAEIDPVGSSYINGTESYWSTFRILANSSTYLGFYMFNAIALDDTLQTIAESRQDQEDQQQLSGRLLGIDLHSIVNQAFGGYYLFERVDDDGDVLYTVNRGDDFNMTFTISNATLLDRATIYMSAPSNIKTQHWVYGSYYEKHVRQGAWEWNETIGTYVWNPTVNVTWSEPKFGYHWEESYTWVNMGKEYDFYDPWAGEIFTRETWPEYVITYDFTLNSWNYFAACHYENYTWNGEEWEWQEWVEFEPWLTDWPVPFVLNETESSIFYNTLGKLVVNFRGHISEDMLPSGSESGQTIHFYEQVINQYDIKLVNYVNLPIASPQEALDYENQRNLAIESPVSIVKITHKGQPYNPSWIFQANIDETFTVSSRLQGGIEYADDIDGVAFVMYGHQERWGTDIGVDWYQYSDIQVQVKVSPGGATEVNVYNYTVRTSWGFGEHYEWINVEIAPGIWQVERVLITDWFWQEQVWDFVANDWTDQHFPMQSLQAKMPITCLDAGNVTYFVVDDDLKISFDITPQPDMPALEWWWEYFYGNLTWVTDYESGWGSHTVLGWTEDTVYHYWNGTQIVYVEKPYKGVVFHNNETDEVYDRKKVPYVIINGKQEALKSYIFGDMDYTYETLVREEYDYALDETHRFIKLFNGTELEVFGDQTAPLYQIMLLNGTSFLSFQSDPWYMGGADIYSMVGDDGSLIAMPWPEWSGYTSLRIGVVPVTMVGYTLMTYATPLYPYEPFNAKPLYIAGWPEYIGYEHWIMYLNGTWEPVDVWRCHEPGLEHLYMYFNPHDGREYVFDWPWELMRCEGSHTGVLIPHYVTQLFAYVTVDGSNYPIPAPGETIGGWWDLDWIIQSLYSHEIAYINGTPYVAERLPTEHYAPDPYSAGTYPYYIYQVDVYGTLYNLTDWGSAPNHILNYDYFPDELPWITTANGNLFIPEVFRTDWTVALGHRDPSTLEFEVETWIDVTSGYYDGNYGSSQIFDWSTYAYVMTKGGEEYFYNSTWRAVFHNITLSNGTFFYSFMENPQIWPTDFSDWEIDTFYMIDIYGDYQWWHGWDEFTSQVIMVEDILGDPMPGSGWFWFEGTYVPIIEFEVTYWEWDGSSWYNYIYMENNVWSEGYDFIDMKNGTTYEVIPLYATPESQRYNFPSWQFMIDGTTYNISGSSDMIYKAYQFEGYSKKLDYAKLPITILRTQDSIVTGIPEWGMWDIDIWTTNPENGALDLDGNLATTDDQYFVKEMHSSTDYYNITQEFLDVMILWEPDSATFNDEFYLHSFTGMVTFNWTFEWEDNYIWTKASTGETLVTDELNDIKDLFFDEWGNSKPGYWGISWLARNFTSEDLKLQALENGWDWVEGNSREWSWLWWQLDEHYSTDVGNSTYSELMDINLAYEYAGMFAWEDENADNFMDVSSDALGEAEMSHYWMPIDVDSVSFVTPGEAFGNYNSTDTIYVGVNDTIDFGVTFTDVTGMVFPFGEYSYWDWYDGQYYGSDFASFDERPTQCTTDEFSIAVHFTGTVNETGSNIADVKFDLTVGDWDIDTPGGRDVLEDVSLAISFYSDLSITSSAGSESVFYLDDYGQILNNEEATPSSNFTMTAGLTSVALMNLGGYPYTWSKNASQACAVDAQTVPLSAVSAIYTSGSGGSATSFSITSEQFYTLIGFRYWDGYALTVDPVFVGYISHGTSDSSPPSINSIVHTPVQISGVDYVHIEAEVTDTGGSDLAEVKVWDTDNNENYSMSYDEGLGKYVVEIERTEDGRYTFNYRIVASDTSGNTAVSGSNAFLFRDNIDPVVGVLSFENNTDSYGREIAIISAPVSDAGGSDLASVVLTYSNSSGAFNVPMSLVGGLYEGVIPNHESATVVHFWVTATDGDGNSVQSSIEEFIFSVGSGPDTNGPSISLVSHDPTNPTPTSVVTVSANIQDIQSGVASAVLQYKIDSGDWTNITMTSVGDVYSAEIPAQVDGTTVTYRIVAVDTIGNERISGEVTYTVAEAITTTTTTTPTETTSTTTGTGTSPGLLSGQTLLLVIGGIGALVVVVVILGMVRKRS